MTIYAITGANSGVGKALADNLSRELSKSRVIRINGPEQRDDSGMSFDLSDSDQVSTAASAILNETHFLKSEANREYAGHQAAEEVYGDTVLINCAGFNYIDWFLNADFSVFDKLMAVNVKAQMLLTRELLAGGWFKGKGCVCNIVSNASHVAMTNSAFYNASKGAAHIGTLAMARELRKSHNLCVFGVSPNKLAGTGMSEYIEGRVPELRGWTPEEAAQYQINALPAGEETDVQEFVEFLTYILSAPRRYKFLTNTVIPYGA